MYLFSRNTRVLSGAPDVLTDIVALTDYVNRNTELDASLWSMVSGQEPGSISWTANVSKRSELLEANDKLVAQPDYWNIVNRVQPHVTPMTDALMTPLHAAGRIPDATAFASTTGAFASGSKPLHEAVAWAVEVADLAHEITGSPVMVMANSIGPIGQIGWMGFGESMDEIDEHQQALWQDPRYMPKLAEAVGMFAGGPGAMVWRRMA